MKLIGGPYNDREIDDCGAVTLQMCIWDGGVSKLGVNTGIAIYEPNEDRTLAFWLTNKWLGTIEGIIEA